MMRSFLLGINLPAADVTPPASRIHNCGQIPRSTKITIRYILAAWARLTLRVKFGHMRWRVHYRSSWSLGKDCGVLWLWIGSTDDKVAVYTEIRLSAKRLGLVAR